MVMRRIATGVTSSAPSTHITPITTVIETLSTRPALADASSSATMRSGCVLGISRSSHQSSMASAKIISLNISATDPTMSTIRAKVSAAKSIAIRALLILESTAPDIRSYFQCPQDALTVTQVGVLLRQELAPLVEIRQEQLLKLRRHLINRGPQHTMYPAHEPHVRSRSTPTTVANAPVAREA